MKKKLPKELYLKTKLGTFKVHIWWDQKDKAYLVKVPSLPGTNTFGTSLREAKIMAKDAIELNCECLIDEGKIVIDDAGRVFGRIPKSKMPKLRIISVVK
jgi:predicted RNase H-like HicB family nuclease